MTFVPASDGGERSHGGIAPGGLSAETIEILKAAMLPLDGNIADDVPEIYAACRRLIPARDWPRLAYVDLTAGSCLLPMMFAAAGIGRIVVNDPAARTVVAARALFGGQPIDPDLVRRLVLADTTATRPHVPSFHFACDYLTEPVARVFDRLYHADVAPAQSHGLRYLALLWALSFTESVEDGFRVLMTHDEEQLLSMTDEDWRGYIARSRRPIEELTLLSARVNGAIAALATTDVVIFSEDLKAVCARIDYAPPCIVAVNPPTNGLDEYVIDDQIVHSLLANRWLPLSRSRESARDFWSRRVEAALDAVPPGTLCQVWGGDGAMTWDECCRVWLRYGDECASAVRQRGDKRAGWLILRRGRARS